MTKESRSTNKPKPHTRRPCHSSQGNVAACLTCGPRSRFGFLSSFWFRHSTLSPPACSTFHRATKQSGNEAEHETVIDAPILSDSGRLQKRQHPACVEQPGCFTFGIEAT